jgi:hypothetical protein
VLARGTIGDDIREHMSRCGNQRERLRRRRELAAEGNSVSTAPTARKVIGDATPRRRLQLALDETLQQSRRRMNDKDVHDC